MPDFTPGPWKFNIETEANKANDYVDTPIPITNEAFGWIKGPNKEKVVEYKDCGSHMAAWNTPDLYLILQATELYKAVEFFLNNLGRDPEADDEMIEGVQHAKQVMFFVKKGNLE